MLTVEMERAMITRGQRVLDLGCGGGRHAFACLKSGADVVAFDASEPDVRSVSKMVELMRGAGEIDNAIGLGVVGEATMLPIRDGAFDRVIAAEVLEHLGDDSAAIGELVRVLRRGGLMALSVPRRGPERVNWALSREYHEVDGGHLRIYRRSELIGLCERLGLRFRSGHYAHGLHSPYWWLRCAVGVRNEDHFLVAAYHRFLVWDIVARPRLTRIADRLLNPLIGKSLVLYFEKPE